MRAIKLGGNVDLISALVMVSSNIALMEPYIQAAKDFSTPSVVEFLEKLSETNKSTHSSTTSVVMESLSRKRKKVDISSPPEFENLSLSEMKPMEFNPETMTPPVDVHQDETTLDNSIQQLPRFSC